MVGRYIADSAHSISYKAKQKANTARLAVFERFYNQSKLYLFIIERLTVTHSDMEEKA